MVLFVHFIKPAALKRTICVGAEMAAAQGNHSAHMASVKIKSVKGTNGPARHLNGPDRRVSWQRMESGCSVVCSG